MGKRRDPRLPQDLVVSACSERMQLGVQTGSLLQCFSFATRGCEFQVLQRFPLRLQIGASVDVGAIQAGVPKPILYDGDVHTAFQQMDRGCVTKRVRSDPLRGQPWCFLSGGDQIRSGRKRESSSLAAVACTGGKGRKPASGRRDTPFIPVTQWQ